MILEMPKSEPWMRQDPPEEVLGEPWQFLSQKLGKWAQEVQEATTTATRDGWAGGSAEATTTHNRRDEDNIQQLQKLCGQAADTLTEFWMDWKKKSRELQDLDQQFASEALPQDKAALEMPFYIYKDTNSTDKLPSGRDYETVASAIERLKHEAQQKIRQLQTSHENTQHEFGVIKARIREVTDVKDLGKTMGQIFKPGTLASFSLLGIRSMSDQELVWAAAAGRLKHKAFNAELIRLGNFLGDAINGRKTHGGDAHIVWTEDMAKAMGQCGGQQAFTQAFLASATIERIVLSANTKHKSSQTKYFAQFLDGAAATGGMTDAQVDEYIVTQALMIRGKAGLDPDQLLNALDKGSPFAAAYLRRSYALNKTDVFRDKGLVTGYRPWAVTESMNICLEKLNAQQQYDFFVGNDDRANVDVMRDFAVQAGFTPGSNGLNAGTVAHVFHQLAVADLPEDGKPVTQKTHASTSVAAAIIDIYSRQYTGADYAGGGASYSGPGAKGRSISTGSTRRIFTQTMAYRIDDTVAIFGGSHDAKDLPPGSVRFRTEADAYAPDSKVTSYPGVSKDQMRAFMGPLMINKESSQTIHDALQRRVQSSRTPDSDPFSSKPGEYMRTAGELHRSAKLAAEDKQQVLEDQDYDSMIDDKAPSQVAAKVISIVPVVGDVVSIGIDPLVSNSNDKMHRATDNEWKAKQKALEKRHDDDAEKRLGQLQDEYSDFKDEVDLGAKSTSNGLVSKEFSYPTEWEGRDGIDKNVEIRKSRSAGPHRQALTDAELEQEIEDRRQQCDRRTNWRRNNFDYSQHWQDEYLKKAFKDGYNP